jgi:hypothetical protein
MNLLLPWIVFTLVLAFLSLGLGLLVDRITAGSVPRPLLLPVGCATSITVTSIAVSVPGAARLATPLVVALAAAGLVLGLRPHAISRHATGAAVAVFICYGAPVIASGSATFAGFIKLDDTATFLALADRAIEHGRSVSGLAPSTYEATVSGYLDVGYPLGSVLPLGIGHDLLRTDVAWLYQPWLSFAAAMIAFGIYRLAAPLIRRDWLRALVALVSAQPALLYGFALWGGVKELVAAALLVAAAALAGDAVAAKGLRNLVPLAIVGAALLNTLSVGAPIWLAPLLLGLIPLLRRSPLSVALALLVCAVLALPMLVTAGDFLQDSNRTIFESGTELGNLIRPLRSLQMVGIWPNGDFRLDPSARTLTALLLGLAVLAAGVGLWLAVARRAIGLLLAVASVLTGAVVYTAFGSPWVAAKALAIGSPVVLLTVLGGCAGVFEGALPLRRLLRVPAVVASATVGVLVAAGVVWSNVLAYHDVDLAPRGQLAELEEIGDRFVGQGPALMNEYEPYGVRHFLRRLDAEGVSELRRRPIPLRDGRLAGKGEYVDLDQLQLPALLVYRTLVLRRSPTESRPPSPYRLVWQGRWYQVWQQRTAAPVVDHVPLGGGLQPAGIAPCSLLQELGARGRLAAPPRTLNLVWALSGDVLPAHSGTETLDILLRRGGRFVVWLGGSTRGRLRVDVDGRKVGSASKELQGAGQWLRMGAADLAGGTHRVTIGLSLPVLEPGVGGAGFPLGPLLLQPVARERIAAPADARALCGQTLDWAEALTR